MNTKTILGISIAAILAISVVSISTLPNAFAKQDFTGKPDFIAIINAEQIPEDLIKFPAGPFESESKAKGVAHFWVNEDETELFYKIKLNGLRLDEVEGETPGNGATELVTKIHFHNSPPGVNGPHVLNVLGSPGPDDLDVNVNPMNGVITGIWDDGDAKNYGMPGRDGPDSVALTVVDPFSGEKPLDDLCDDKIYVNIHSDLGSFENAVGAIRGQVIPQPNGFCE